MKLAEFNKLLKDSSLTKKELSNLMNTPQATVNGWGVSGKKIPAWIESWLKNYIELHQWKEHFIACNDKLRKLEEDSYKEPIGIYEDTTTKEIALANLLNKSGSKKIADIKELKSGDIEILIKDILQLKEDVETLKKSQKAKK